MEPSSYSRPQMRPPGRPVGDLRTPVAWRQREFNLNHQQQQQHHHQFQEQQQQPQQHQQNHQRRGGGVPSAASQPISSTDTTAEEEEEEEEEEQRGVDGDESSELETSVSGQRKRLQQQQRHRQRYNRMHHQSHCAAIKTQTIRSTRSVPALERASWPSEGATALCPVHGGYTMHPGHPQHHQHHLMHPQRQHHGHDGRYPDPYVGGGGGPAGIHHMRRAGSMFDLRPTGGQLTGHYYPPASSAICGSLHRPLPIRYGPSPPLPLPVPLFRTLERNGNANKKTSHYGSLRSLHSLLHPLPINPLALQLQPPPPPPYNLPPMPPPHLLPPGMRPRQLVIPAGVEPLPVRDPTKSKVMAAAAAGGAAGVGGLKNGSSTLKGSKAMEVSGRGAGADFNDDEDAKRRCHCCRGPALPIIWFIVTIITVGVVLGVILGSIYG